MKKTIVVLACLLVTLVGEAQPLEINSGKFHLGDNMEWKNPNYDDSSWESVKVPALWNEFNLKHPYNYAWYRLKVVIPKAILSQSDQQEVIKFYLGKVDDCDETYLNGVLIGKAGTMPIDGKKYREAWDEPRNYLVKASSKYIKWDQENVIAVRVFNGNDPGGIDEGPVTVSLPRQIEGIELAFNQDYSDQSTFKCGLTVTNNFPKLFKGTVTITSKSMETGEIVATSTKKLSLGKAPKTFAIGGDKQAISEVEVKVVNALNGESIVRTYYPKYILTPKAPASPRYNGPLVYGVRPTSPVIFRIPVSGERPMKFAVKNLPEGLSLDAENGVISGSIAQRGAYNMTFVCENAKGKIEQPFTIKVDNKIALTPPMGWNSWNCWGLSVSQEKVISSAQAIIDKGLADYGYAYINIDDAWEAPERNADGTIATNEKFGDMKGLGDWLHQNGLKFGIYSSPGDRTCGGYLGSLDHEAQDAKTYNDWGIDYLKYDWCGYYKVFNEEKDFSVAAYVRPYLKMEQYLRQQPRDIFYSLCQYGMADVWKWGHAVDANSWRTTGDIVDTWESLYSIGFEQQRELAPYAKPGGWNDPDMLIVGKVGWSSSLRDSRLTPDEQYTHISLWSLLAANMLIGCDVAQIDDFTIGLLCNNEVNAVNQDILGQQAKPEVIDGDIQIWKRPLADGSFAVGIFNVGKEAATVDFAAYFDHLGIGQLKSVRDLWRQKDLSTADVKYFIPTHGVKYVKITY